MYETIAPLTNFGLLFGVFCFCVWPSFIGAVLSVIRSIIAINGTNRRLHTCHDYKSLGILDPEAAAIKGFNVCGNSLET